MTVNEREELWKRIYEAEDAADAWQERATKAEKQIAQIWPSYLDVFNWWKDTVDTSARLEQLLKRNVSTYTRREVLWVLNGEDDGAMHPSEALRVAVRKRRFFRKGST